MAATPRAARLLAALKEKDKINKSASKSNLESEINQRLANLESAILKDESDGKDYLTVCREYMAQHGVSMLDAQRQVDRIRPELRRAYIRKNNPHLTDEDF